MIDPATAREALLAEAIGEVARLIEEVRALAPTFVTAGQALEQANTSLRNELAGFERRMSAITENAKVQALKHVALRTDEAARRTIELQSRAMADAARVAFGVELGATMQRLQSKLQPLLEARGRSWEMWLTHAAAAAAGSAATWSWAVRLGPG